MAQKTWHEKLFCTEAMFHTLAIACVLKAFMVPSNEAMAWIGAASGVAALGRSMPTERVDDALSIPLVKPQSEDTPE